MRRDAPIRSAPMDLTRIAIGLSVLLFCHLLASPLAAAPSPLAIQLKAPHQFRFAGPYMAVEQEFYTDEGFAVTLNEPQPDKSTIQSVLEGDAAYGIGDTGLLLARQQGRPVVLLKQIFQHAPAVLVTRRDSKTLNPFDLLKKRVVLNPRDPGQAPITAMLIDTLGDLSQIRLIETGSGPEAFLAGKADALTVTSAHQLARLKQHGPALTVIDPRNYGIDFYGDNLFTTEAEIRDHPQRVAGVIRATLRGWQYVLAHPQETIALIRRKYTPELTRAQLADEAEIIERLIQPEAIPLGTIIPRRYLEMANVYESLGHTAAAIDWAGFFHQPPVGISLSPKQLALKLTAAELAWLKAHPHIRFGVDADYAPYSFRDANNRYRGIVMAFCEYLGRQLGFSLEVVPDLSWPEIVDGVRERTLDVVATMSHRPEREAFVNFTEIYLPTPLVIMRRSGDSSISSEADLNGRTVALVEGYSSSASVMAAHPEVKSVPVKTALGGLFAVATGKADAYVGVLGINLYLAHENGITNLEVASLFGAGTNGQRFGVRKDWPELAAILDKALAAMPEADRRRLFEPWLPAHTTPVPSKRTIPFTPEEKAWLGKHPRIEIGVMNAWPPFDFIDPTGRPQGIGVDFIKALNKRLGNLLVVKPGAWTDIYAAVQSKKLAALLDITPKPSREADFNFTRPYLSVPHVIVAPSDTPDLRFEDDLAGKTLALEKGFGNVGYFSTNYPQVRIKEYPDTAAALDAVARGEADAYAGNRAVATYLLEKEVLLNLKVHGRLKKNGSILAIGVRKDWPVLRDILQKALDSLTGQEKRNILRNWVKAVPPEIALKPAEKAWLAAHRTIRVSNTLDYAPFDFRENGRPAGYSIDYMKLLFDRLGIQATYVSDTWGNLLKKAELRELDLIHTIFNAPVEREVYLNFTKPYRRTTNAIITRTDTSAITGLDDLEGHTVALVSGDSSAALIPQHYPQLHLVAVDSYEDALKAVAFGRAEATVTEMPIATYLIRKLLLTNLNVSAEIQHISQRDQNYRIAVRKDWPELIPILEKAMHSITPEELAALDSRWLSPLPSPVKTDRPLIDRRTIAVIAATLVLAIGVILVLFRLLDRSKRNPLAYQFASPAGKRTAVLLNGVLIVLAVSLAWLALTNIKDDVKADMRESLQTILQTTHETMSIWIRDQQNELNKIAADPRVIRMAAVQLRHYAQGGDLLAGPALMQLRDLFTEFQRISNHIGFFIIAPDGISIASMRDANIGTVNLIQQQRPDLLHRAFSGETVFIPPIASDVLLQKAAPIAGRDRPPTMFFAAPIRNSGGEVIAVLTERFNPHGDFSRINLLGRIGYSGETYTFNRSGQLLSESRFLHHLLATGLLQPGEQSILSVALRDPGVNLVAGKNSLLTREGQPLTRMAASAIRGVSGYDVEGYRDYRGVPVIGAWAWDEPLGFGMTSEIDVTEALQTYYSARLAVIFTVGATVTISVALTLLTMLLSSRANRALQKSRDGLEQRVHERTLDLQLAKEAALTGERQIRAIFESASEGIVTVNRQGRILLVNHTLEQMFGYETGALTGQSVEVLLPERVREVHVHHRQDYLKSPRPRKMGLQKELYARHLDGTEFPVDVSLNFVNDGDNLQAIAFVMDITVQKLHQELLEQAKESAEAANRAKSLFLANMSHEIRTPMNAILGYSQIMQHDPALTGEQKTNVAIINRSGDHLLALINDVLEMSKIEAGHIELTPAPFDLHALLEDLELMFRARSAEKLLTFTVATSAEVPHHISADEGKVRQVLINLLGNAVKFTDTGTVKLRASCSPEVPAKNRLEALNGSGTLPDLAPPEPKRLRLVFELADTGPGISLDQQETIFNAFEQTVSGNQAEGGTGLGLAISRKYARLMDGDITVTSEAGKGSVFRFEMIAESAVDTATKTKTAARRQIVGLRDSASPPHVMIVDDREYNVDILRKMLTRVGFEVSEARNGREAVDLYTRSRPQAILMDVRMPVMDGLEATRQIRRIESHHNFVPGTGPTRIIAVSASALEIQRKAIMQPGLADDFIGKPFKEAEIYDALARHLGVEYIFADTATDDLPTDPGWPTAKAREAINRLPDELKTGLRKAVVELELDRLQSLIGRIGTHEGELAAMMIQLADRFDFERLGRWVAADHEGDESNHG